MPEPEKHAHIVFSLSIVHLFAQLLCLILFFSSMDDSGKVTITIITGVIQLAMVVFYVLHYWCSSVQGNIYHTVVTNVCPNHILSCYSACIVLLYVIPPLLASLPSLCYGNRSPSERNNSAAFILSIAALITGLMFCIFTVSDSFVRWATAQVPSDKKGQENRLIHMANDLEVHEENQHE